MSIFQAFQRSFSVLVDAAIQDGRHLQAAGLSSVRDHGHGHGHDLEKLGPGSWLN